MTENSLIPENTLVERAIVALRDLVPAAWEIERSALQMAPAGGEQRRVADALSIRGDSGAQATMIVEAKSTISPRAIEALFSSRLTTTYLQIGSDYPLLFVAEWLSPRTRELLEERGANYLDLTGNAFIRLPQPALFIRTQGSSKSPLPKRTAEVRLRGAKAGRLVRLLLDVRPPFGVRDLAEASGVAVSYVSRLLDTLDRDALIERTDQGGVGGVDVPRLLRRWAESYDVFASNQAVTYLAPKGPKDVLRRLPGLTNSGRVAVTGSFAAVRLEPVAGPSFLMMYAWNQELLAERLGLLPTEEGSNIALLTAYDPIVWEANEEGGGTWDREDVPDPVRYVAPSQVAIDCLTGNGRMPQEGEAVVKWLMANTDVWRASSLARYRLDRGEGA